MNETKIPRYIIERNERRWAEKLKHETRRWQESRPVRPATVSKVETDVPVVRSRPCACPFTYPPTLRRRAFRHASLKLPLRFKGRKPATAVTSEQSKDSDTMARKASRPRANARERASMRIPIICAATAWAINHDDIPSAGVQTRTSACLQYLD